MKKYLYFATLLEFVMVGGAVAFATGIQNTGAVTDTILSTAVRLNRLRVSYTDVRSAPTSTDPTGVCSGVVRKLTVYTTPASGQVDSIVTKVGTAFAGPGIASMKVRAIRAEQNGTQLSNGDVGTPHPDLMDTTYIENHIPPNGEYGFYDESNSWDVVAYFCGQDAIGLPTDISGLTAGSVDFIIQTTKP